MSSHDCKPNRELKATYKRFGELTAEQRDQAFDKFPATSLINKSYDDYVYEILDDGYVLSRKSLAEYERQTAILIKPEGASLRIGGWDL